MSSSLNKVNNNFLLNILSNPITIWALILIFIIVKLFHLNIAYFWDESWVYAPALITMAENGPSLLPDAIPLEYSRGHPLLFHFLGGIWIKLFGAHQISLHSFALAISIAFLTISRLLLLKVFNPLVAFWVIAALIVQPLFMAQSSMVLPEMLLATLSVAAFYFYIKNQLGWYILFGVLTILTKETGILIVVAIVLYDFINNIFNRKKIKEIISNGMLLSIPLLALLIHMAYLKYMFGWFLYPEHTGMVKGDLISIITSFSHVINDQMFIQKRFILSSLFLLGYIYYLIKDFKTFNVFYLIISLLVGTFFLIFHEDHFAFSFLFIAYSTHLCITSFIFSKDKTKILLLFWIFFMIYGLFAASNFYTVRYLLSSFPFIIAIPIYFLVNEFKSKIWIQVLVLLALIPTIVELINPQKSNDVNLTYLYYCPAQQEVVDYFEDNQLYDEQINTMFLSSVALNDKLAGYRTTAQDFTSVNVENNSGVDYYIFYNIEQDGNRDKIKEDKSAELIKRIEKNHIWFEIWKKKN